LERVILHSDLNCFTLPWRLCLTLRYAADRWRYAAQVRAGTASCWPKVMKPKIWGKTGLANWEAKMKCPGLIMLPPRYEEYLKYSKLTRSIYERYTNLVEPFGMDECWCDVTGSKRLFGDGMTIAEEIRQAVKEELGLTVSIGVSYNKVLPSSARI